MGRGSHRTAYRHSMGYRYNAWVLVDPEQAAALGEINEFLLGNVDTVGEWFVLAVASGVGEEILFRGALQPVLGIVAQHCSLLLSMYNTA